MLEKIQNLFLLDNDYEEDIEELDDSSEKEENEISIGVIKAIGHYKNSKNSVKDSNLKRIQIIKLDDLNDVMIVMDQSANGDCVIVNMENIENKVQQRVMDTIGGYCYSSKCTLEKVNEKIYIISNNND